MSKNGPCQLAKVSTQGLICRLKRLSLVTAALITAIKWLLVASRSSWIRGGCRRRSAEVGNKNCQHKRVRFLWEKKIGGKKLTLETEIRAQTAEKRPLVGGSAKWTKNPILGGGERFSRRNHVGKSSEKHIFLRMRKYHLHQLRKTCMHQRNRPGERGNAVEMSTKLWVNLGYPG